MESSWPSSDHCSWSSIPNITVSPDEDYRATRDAGERKGELESNRGERERERERRETAVIVEGDDGEHVGQVAEIVDLDTVFELISHKYQPISRNPQLD